MTHACLLGPAGFIAGAGLPLTDRGFRYGMSVFETIAIRNGTPLLLAEHLAKLAEAAATAGFQPTALWRSATRTLFDRPPIHEGVARIYITAGDAAGSESRVAALFEHLPIPTTLGRSAATTVEFTPALPFGKTGNYWPHFLARPADGSEAILCQADGRVLGGTMSNLFLICGGELLTPGHPIRSGVIRDWVRAREADLERGDLLQASSAFLTNSRFGIHALTSIDGRTLAVDPRVESLWQRYATEVLRAG